MPITTVYIIDLLTENSVSIITKKFIEIEGNPEPVQVGEKIRTAYVNSAHDRVILQNFLPETHYNAIIAMWGSEPTVDDLVIE